MSKYLFLYRGPATPMDQFSAEESEKQMQAWGAWMQRVASQLADAGAPFGARDAVCDDGSAATASDQNGYSIIEADSLEAARTLTEGHPFLAEGKGRFTIDIYELVPM
jgi:YCII-related domain